MLKEEGVLPPADVPDAYAIVPDAQALPRVFQLVQALRARGVRVQMHAGSGEGMGSMKSQFKKADASGARFALIFGADEMQSGQLTIKSLRDGSGQQRMVTMTDWATWAPSLKAHTL